MVLIDLILLIGSCVVSSFVLRHIPAVPEPKIRLKTPFGKLPFFDGVILYGSFMLILLGVVTILQVQFLNR